MSNLSRRRFIFMAGISASAVILKGCVGNPPEPEGNNTANNNC